MALPIIVPAWDFEMHYQCQKISVLPKRLQPKPVRALRLMDVSDSAALEPSERELLIMRWRRIANVHSLIALDGKAVLSTNNPSMNDTESENCGVSLLATCEWLLRKRLRQDWALLHTANRAQVLMLGTRFKRELPIVNATDLGAAAAGWTLFAMYWCGASHPAAMFSESLHPPTGLVRWISQFHVNQQRTEMREIQAQFARYLGVTRMRCDVLIQRMLKRTGSMALLQELCDF
jgi:hypothetical protein